MRISDWSSDVCSSDLRCGQRAHFDIVARHDARTQLLRDRVGAAAAGDGARRLGEVGGEFGRLRLCRPGREIERNLLQAEHRVARVGGQHLAPVDRSEEHTSELQSLMRISYAVFCLKKKK